MVPSEASTCLIMAACGSSLPALLPGVVDLYHGLAKADHEQIVHAYETWGFTNLSKDLVEALNVWARFIYGPLLDDRVRSIADGISPAEYGRKQAFKVHQEFRRLGPVTVPREFVFMDRAAIGLGGCVPASGRRAQFS